MLARCGAPSFGARVSPAGIWVRFGPIALAQFCTQLDFFALGLALPVIADDFGVTVTDLQWVISGYLLSLGACMIPASRLADLLGRKRVLLVGVLVFGAASLACGLSTSPVVLVAARVVQGAGGAMIMPIAVSLVTHATTATDRARALGLVIGLANIGTAIGPIVGGALASTIGWRWIFLVNVPVALVCLVWGSRTIVDSSDPGSRTVRDLDWTGLVLVSVGVATASFGLDSIAEFGAFSAPTALGLLVGVAALAAFVRQERRHPWPLVSPALMRRTDFVVTLGAGTAANAAQCLMIIVVTIQLQQVRGFSPLIAGLVFAVPAIGTALCGPASGWLAPRYAPSRVLGVSIAAGGLGLVLQAASGSLAVDVLGLAVSGFALGMGFNFTMVATQSLLPVALTAEASGVVLTSMVTLGGLGVIAGTLLLELFGGAEDLGGAAVTTLLWAGVVTALGGAVLAWTQRRASVPVR